MKATHQVPVVCGLGAALPMQRITNEEIHRTFGVEPAWIESRTGVRLRHRAGAGVTTSGLATAAARQALASAGKSEVDLVVVATATPVDSIPATAPTVAHRLGLSNTAAYDINAVCSGFVYALAQASAAITAEHAQSALVIGADTFSSVLGPADGVNHAIFGDGAGAVVLRAGSRGDPGQVLRSTLRSDGSGGRKIWVPGAEDGLSPYFHMDGREVFKEAVTKMTEISRETAASVKWGIEEIDWLVPHQANQRILNQVAVALGLGSSAAVMHLDEVGNTSAASIPLAMTRHHERFAPGDKMLLTAFGGGFTWGATALTWPQGMNVPPITYLQASEKD